MWKKDEEQATTTGAATTTRPSPRSSGGEALRRAVIGPSISIKGDVTGSEDLLIEGEVDGSVSLGDHSVGVGSEGRVNADIVGRVITVDGHVEGNLKAQEQIVLRGTAKVRGDIKAPRVVLEDGATFRGLVDMGTPAAKDTDSTESKKTNGVSAGGSEKKAESKANGPSEAATASDGPKPGDATKSGKSGSKGGPAGASAASAK